MRTTVTLDEDVAARLRREMRRSGESFKETVNRLLRLGFSTQARRREAPGDRFVIRPLPLGEILPGLSLDNIGELLERVEGPLHR